MPRPPTNLRVSDVTSESVRLTWSYDIDQETIQYYVIQYKQKHGLQQVGVVVRTAGRPCGPAALAGFSAGGLASRRAGSVGLNFG